MEVLQWIRDNWKIIVSALSTLISLGSYLYAAIIHAKSKSRLNSLEAKKEAEAELLEKLEQLNQALKEDIK